MNTLQIPNSPLKKFLPILIGGIAVIVVSVVLVRHFNSKPNSPNQTNLLESYNKKLEQLVRQMTTNTNSNDNLPYCLIDISKYQTDKVEVTLLINNPTINGIIKNKQADQKVIDQFNSLVTQIQTLFTQYDKLVSQPDCKDCCYQGTWDDTNYTCICGGSTDTNFLPIIVDGKVYCSIEPCSEASHQQFMPGNTTDPSSNQCICQPGFIRDKNGNCVEQKNQSTKELEDLKTQLEAHEKNLSFFFCQSKVADETVNLIEVNETNAAIVMKNGYGIIDKQAMQDYQAEQQKADALVNKYKNLPSCDSYCGSNAVYDFKNNVCKCKDPNSSFKNVIGKCQCNANYEPGQNVCVPVGNNATLKVQENTKTLIQLQKQLALDCTDCIPSVGDMSLLDQTMQLATSSLSLVKVQMQQNPGPSVSSITQFNITYQSLVQQIQTIKNLNLPSCDSYCFQASYNFDSHNCKCPDAYPVKIFENGKTYCWTQECNGQHQIFTPGNQDPSSNSCTCETGYVSDGTGCVPQADQQLKEYTKQLKLDDYAFNLKVYFCQTAAADLIVQALEGYITNADALISAPGSIILPQTLADYKTEKQVVQTKITTYKNSLSCDSYCFQAGYNIVTNKCNDCKVGTQQVINNQVYCNNCPSKSNLVPGNKDPTQNQCTCQPNFYVCGEESNTFPASTGTKCENCDQYITNGSTKLGMEQTDMMSNAVSSTNYQIYGQYKPPTSVNNYTIYPSSDVSDKTKTKAVQSMGLIDCLDILDKNYEKSGIGYNMATFDESSKVCNLYYSTNTNPVNSKNLTFIRNK